MAECAIARCVQERRSFKKELQKWGKNVLFLVGLERVAEELVGRDKWKRLSAPINELENQLVTDWEPESVCCFCNNTKQLSDPSKGICSLDSLSNYNNGADSDGQMSEVFKIKVRSPDTVAKREFDFMDLDEMKGNIEVTKLKGHSRKILTASRKLEDVKNKDCKLHTQGMNINHLQTGSSETTAETETEKMEVIDLTCEMEVDSLNTKLTENNWNEQWDVKYMILRSNDKIVCLLCGSCLSFDQPIIEDHIKQKHTTYLSMSSINKGELYIKLCSEYKNKRTRKENKQQLRIFDYFKLNQKETAEKPEKDGEKHKKLRL